MAGIQLSRTIAGSPEAVFDVFTDLDRAAERISGIVRIEKLTAGPLCLGTRWRETRVLFKKQATEELEVTAFDAPRSYTVECESCGCRYATTFSFAPQDAGTRVTVDFRYRAVTFGARLFSPLAALMSGSLRKCMEKDLDDLARIFHGRRSETA